MKKMNTRNLLEKGLSVDLINKEAKKEKLAVPPMNRMHYYFTRKPLISSRLAIAGALLDAESIQTEREHNVLFGLDPTLKKRAYRRVPTILRNLIKKQYPEGVTILDPFAGSGMIPFEALRLGVNVVTMDYNPVACLIQRGTFEYPIKYGMQLYRVVEKHAETIFQKLKTDLEYLYPLHNGVKPRAYVHAWAVQCAVCGKITPLVNNWWLSKKENIHLKYEVFNGELVYSIIEDGAVQEGNIRRGTATCLFCSSRIENKHIVSDISKKEREILLAVYLDNRTFELPTDEDRKAIENAKLYLKDNSKELSRFIPVEELPDDKRSVPAKKYLKYWYRLFNPRQMVVLSSLCKEIRTIVDRISIEDAEYASAVGTYLSMILAKHADRNSRGTQWDNSHKKIGHTLAIRGISMMWNHAETNPFIKFSGSLIGMKKNVLDGLKFSINELNAQSLTITEKPSVEINHNSILSWQTDRKFKFIVTDPPYYDDVPYPEIMQFFQIWHNRTLGHLMAISATPSTTESLSVNQNRSKEMFEKRMFVAFKRLYSLLDEDGVLVMFYVHKSIEGWKYVVEALRKTGFVVTSTISLLTESENSVIARGKSSIFHSLLITARKRTEDKKASLTDIEDEIRAVIEERYPDLERIYGKDRTNLLVSAHGIAIEVITQYSEITSFTKNTVDYALEISQRYLIEYFARNNLKVDNLDPTTMIYTWLRHSLKEEIAYTDYNQTLKALGLNEDSGEDIIHRETGNRSRVQLLDYSQRGTLEKDGEDPLNEESLIDAIHVALRAYMSPKGGITEAKAKIDQSRYSQKDIINTIEALSKIRFTDTSYSEGETCARFMQDWGRLHSTPQPRDISKYGDNKKWNPT